MTRSGRIAVVSACLMLVGVTSATSVGVADDLTLLGRWDDGGRGPTRAVAVSGTHAYVGVSRVFKIIDVSNPASPLENAHLELPGEIYGIALGGSYAYVADFDRGMRIVDVSNPTAPALVGSFDTPGNTLGVTVSGAYPYVADDNWGVRIVDVSNPATPREISSYGTASTANRAAASLGTTPAWTTTARAW